MKSLADALRYELTVDILPFWMSRMKDPSGGFYGRMDGKGAIHTHSEKGAILNARILWTFASAYKTLGGRKYLDTAKRAYEYIRDYFVDREFGGIYWSLDADGRPLDTKKQFYAIAFVIYGLAEYSMATGDIGALELAKGLFRSIEGHSYDRVSCGYIEACTRKWGVIGDMRLSKKDQNDVKTMNTHLHILEAYTALYRVWKDKVLASALKGLIEIFLERIIRPNGHLGLFFGEDWSLHSTIYSYGHDIEASWLLCEAAEVLGDKALLESVIKVSSKVAVASLEGFTPEGGMEYEYNPVGGKRNPSRDWWVQAETVVGCVNQYQLTGETVWMERAIAAWDFIRRHIICPDGEWYWSAMPIVACGTDTSSGRGIGFVPNTDDDRAGFWKCPYHNGRMCLEIMERL